MVGVVVARHCALGLTVEIDDCIRRVNRGGLVVIHAYSLHATAVDPTANVKHTAIGRQIAHRRHAKSVVRRLRGVYSAATIVAT